MPAAKHSLPLDASYLVAGLDRGDSRGAETAESSGPCKGQLSVTSVGRRAFLREAGTVSIATAAATIVPGAVRDAPAMQSGRQGLAWKKAPCGLCGVGCGLLIGLANGRAVAVKGDPDSPVSRGLGCAKGYYSIEALAGSDRIRRALVRRDGRLGEVPLSEALDLVARRLQATLQRHGKDSVGIYGSAEWSLPEAYLASKLFKGALGTNNVETSGRLHAASAMAGLQGSFGLDGAIGCYEDIEHADVFVLWDANLAETDPVLFSRILDRRRKNAAVRIVELATRTTRTSYAADHSLLHVPHAGLAIANAICHEIVSGRQVDREFVDRYVAFKRGRAGLGTASAGDALSPDEPVDADWAQYVAFLASYAPERVQSLSGLSVASIRWLASVYADRALKVTTIWGAEVNQDSRGTWMNNVLYNIHLLVGKIAAPGNSALGMTGQPAGGNAVHEAGASPNGLPNGTVGREEDRRKAAELWGVPATNVDPTPGHHALSLFRRVERGEVRFLWVMGSNPMATLPNLDRYRRALTGSGAFLVVSETYPNATTEIADVVLPAAMWLEREGIYANAERRLQHFARMVAPPGDATPDAWQMIEVGRRLGFDKLLPYRRGSETEQLWEEYRRFHTDPSTALPSIGELRSRPGVIWPWVAGRETRWRYNTAHDAAASAARGAFDFYGHADHRAWIWLRPHEDPPESPDREYPLWLTVGTVLEHFDTGSVTRRIGTLRRAVPHGYAEMNREDARGLGLRNRDRIRLTSRRGSVDAEVRIEYRCQPPRGVVFVPSFDERLPINRLTLDSYCPVSGQPGGACAVRVERLAAGPRR